MARSTELGGALHVGQGWGGSFGVLEDRDTATHSSEQCQCPSELNGSPGHWRVLHGLSTQKLTEAPASSSAACARWGCVRDLGPVQTCLHSGHQQSGGFK